MAYTVPNIDQLDSEVLSVFNSDNGVFLNQQIEFLESLGLPIQNKSVLELNPGPGFFTPYFTNKGCNTLSLESRQKNIDAFRIVNPNSDIELFDVENSDWSTVSARDVCFCVGPLYHVRDPESLIQKIEPVVNEFVIVESVVTWHDEDILITNTIEHSNVLSESINGVGSRPGRKKLWQTLKSYFPFVYTPLTQPEGVDFPKNTSLVSDSDGTNKRVYFICSKVDLNNPNLSLLFVDQYN